MYHTTNTDQNVPTKKISKAKLKLKSKPWITKEILKSIRRKNKLYKNHFNNNFNKQVKLQEYKNTEINLQKQ